MFNVFIFQMRYKVSSIAAVPWCDGRRETVFGPPCAALSSDHDMFCVECSDALTGD